MDPKCFFHLKLKFYAITCSCVLINMPNMPNFVVPPIMPSLQAAPPQNLITQPFLHLSAYDDDATIKKAFPSAMNYNDPNFDPDSIKSAEFFIVRSTCDDDIHKSIKYGIWTSGYRNNQVFHNAYVEAKKTNSPVYFFYTVVGSEQYSGVAMMTSDVDMNKSFNYWWEEAKWTSGISLSSCRSFRKY